MAVVLTYAVHVRRAEHAHVLERRPGEIYVHYVNTDKRMDEWVPEHLVRSLQGQKQEPSGTSTSTAEASRAISHVNGTKKRKRSSSVETSHDTKRVLNVPQLVPSEIGGVPADDDPRTLKMSEEEYDLEHHKQLTARRNFDKVIFGRWSIRTWYFSPYPLMENELESEASSTPGPSSSVGPAFSSAGLASGTGAHAPRALPPSMGHRLPPCISTRAWPDVGLDGGWTC